MSFNDHFSAHQRLSILRVLTDSPRYSANNSILGDQLQEFGLDASRDTVRNQILWLEEQALVTVERVGKAILVATLTERGADVASGRATVDGVKRPGPKG
jgi:Fe2+ or Zn2+ uptake regulation protein